MKSIEGLFGSIHDDSLAGDENHQSGLRVLVGMTCWMAGKGMTGLMVERVTIPSSLLLEMATITLSDFGNGDDNIDLTAFENIESIADLAIQQQGNDVVIDLSGHGGGDIKLEKL